MLKLITNTDNERKLILKDFKETFDSDETNVEKFCTLINEIKNENVKINSFLNELWGKLHQETKASIEKSLYSLIFGKKNYLNFNKILPLLVNTLDDQNTQVQRMFDIEKEKLLFNSTILLNEINELIMLLVKFLWEQFPSDTLTNIGKNLCLLAIEKKKQLSEAIELMLDTTDEKNKIFQAFQDLLNGNQKVKEIVTLTTWIQEKNEDINLLITYFWRQYPSDTNALLEKSIVLFLINNKKKFNEILKLITKNDDEKNKISNDLTILDKDKTASISSSTKVIKKNKLEINSKVEKLSEDKTSILKSIKKSIDDETDFLQILQDTLKDENQKLDEIVSFTDSINKENKNINLLITDLWVQLPSDTKSLLDKNLFLLFVENEKSFSELLKLVTKNNNETNQIFEYFANIKRIEKQKVDQIVSLTDSINKENKNINLLITDLWVQLPSDIKSLLEKNLSILFMENKKSFNEFLKLVTKNDNEKDKIRCYLEKILPEKVINFLLGIKLFHENSYCYYNKFKIMFNCLVDELDSMEIGDEAKKVVFNFLKTIFLGHQKFEKYKIDYLSKSNNKTTNAIASSRRQLERNNSIIEFNRDFKTFLINLKPNPQFTDKNYDDFKDKFFKKIGKENLKFLEWISRNDAIKKFNNSFIVKKDTKLNWNDDAEEFLERLYLGFTESQTKEKKLERKIKIFEELNEYIEAFKFMSEKFELSFDAIINQMILKKIIEKKNSELSNESKSLQLKTFQRFLALYLEKVQIEFKNDNLLEIKKKLKEDYEKVIDTNCYKNDELEYFFKNYESYYTHIENLLKRKCINSMLNNIKVPLNKDLLDYIDNEPHLQLLHSALKFVSGCILDQYKMHQNILEQQFKDDSTCNIKKLFDELIILRNKIFHSDPIFETDKLKSLSKIKDDIKELVNVLINLDGLTKYVISEWKKELDLINHNTLGCALI